MRSESHETRRGVARRSFLAAVGGAAASVGVLSVPVSGRVDAAPRSAKGAKFVQPLKANAEELYEYSLSVPVIDCHEHIPGREADYNNTTMRFGNLFNPYVSNDLNSAGMPFPRGVWSAFHVIGDDWDAFEPHWKAVKFGSYARPIRIALQHFYGVNDFTRENYLGIVGKINDGNKPGIYDRIFRTECGIEKVIVCSGALPDASNPLLAGNLFIPLGMNTAPSKAELDSLAAYAGGSEIKTIDELVDATNHWMEAQRKQGAIQFKAYAIPVEHPNKDDAARALELLRTGEALPPRAGQELRAYLREAHARKAAELGVPMAIHTGVWNDFRDLRVEDIVGFIERNPDTPMDIYHLGIPSPRAAIQTIKNYPNAYMNLCWSHIVASDMVVQSLHEAIDMVPLNKVFAFGGDYVLFIEKVFGHLQMARENIAVVLGSRVERNLMDMDDAKQTVRAWFCDNPKKFYKI